MNKYLMGPSLHAHYSKIHVQKCHSIKRETKEFSNQNQIKPDWIIVFVENYLQQSKEVFFNQETLVQIVVKGYRNLIRVFHNSRLIR